MKNMTIMIQTQNLYIQLFNNYMIKEKYRNSPVLLVIDAYLLMTELEIEALTNNEKELINYYKNIICIK